MLQNRVHGTNLSSSKVIQKNCFICQREFKYLFAFTHNPSLYRDSPSQVKNVTCGKMFCYSCLYLIYLDQSTTKVLKIKMPCCNQNGAPMSQIKCLFVTNCIFCGILRKDKQSNINCGKQFIFCLNCYKTAIQVQYFNQRYWNQIIMKIGQYFSEYECQLCQKPLDLLYIQEKSIKAFTNKLCFDCYQKNKNKKMLQTIGNQFQVQIQKQKFNKKKIQSQQCNKCSQKVLFDKNQLRENYLFNWKDEKIYCNICLFFKIDNKINKYLEQKKNLLIQNQIWRVTQLMVCYQNHFNKYCCVCGLENKKSVFSYEKKFHYKQQNLNKNLINNKQFALPLNFCKKCLDTLLNQTSKYKSLFSFKVEIIDRHIQLKQLFIQKRKKQQNQFKFKYIPQQKLNQRKNEKQTNKQKLFQKQQSQKVNKNIQKFNFNQKQLIITEEKTQFIKKQPEIYHSKAYYQNEQQIYHQKVQVKQFEEHFEQFCKSKSPEKCKICQNSLHFLNFNLMCNLCLETYLMKNDPQLQRKVQHLSKTQQDNSKWLQIEKSTQILIKKP